MSETKHTPGPWQVSGAAKSVGIFIYRRDEPDGDNHVRICRNVATVEDARLIAAAPEMLAALKRTEGALDIFTREICGEDHNEDQGCTACDALRMVRAALAKATS